MGAKSKIEWTDATWTPIRARRHDNGKVGVHCELVSEGCKNCYAASHNKRNLPVHGTGLDFTILNREKVEIFVDDEMLLAPIRWKKPRKIFVCSQTDLFADFVEVEQIAQAFAVMALAYWHTHQVLTKRQDRMLSLLSNEDFWELVDGCMAVILDGEVDALERRRDDLRATAPEVSPDQPLLNVWLGVTAENQARADERIPVLLQTPAAKRFVSVEPMLGPVDAGFNRWVRIRTAIRGDFPIGHKHIIQPGVYRADSNQHGALSVNGLGIKPGEYELLPTLDWAICGGESGRGARPMRIEWAESVRDQCQAAGVSFFMKQLGVGPIWAGAKSSPIEPSRGKNDVMEEWPESLRIQEFPNA